MLALATGYLADSLFARRAVVPPPDPLGGREVFYATTIVLLNWLITVLGWFLWRSGVIVFRRDDGWYAWLDVLTLLLVTDFAMYASHQKGVATPPPGHTLVICLA